jgi:hypothetical protein
VVVHTKNLGQGIICICQKNKAHVQMKLSLNNSAIKPLFLQTIDNSLFLRGE